MAKKLRTGEVEHRLLAYFTERLGGPLDGYFGQNYDACAELVKRCVDHGSDPEGTIRTLIDIATEKTCWHAKNATNFRYLLNHGRKIANDHRERFTKKDRLSAATAKADDYLARIRSGANGYTG